MNNKMTHFFTFPPSSFCIQFFSSKELLLPFSFSLEYSSVNSFSRFVYMGSIYTLIRANTFIKDFMGGLSTDQNLSMLNLKSYFYR